MQTRIAFAPILCGLAALAIGLFPGVLSGLVSGIENFKNSITQNVARHQESQINPALHWGFIGVGIAFITFGLFATGWQ